MLPLLCMVHTPLRSRKEEGRGRGQREGGGDRGRGGGDKGRGRERGVGWRREGVNAEGTICSECYT